MPDELLDNFNEFMDSADDDIAKGRWNSTGSLLFKALLALCDRAIFEKSRLIVKNHDERFRALRISFPEVYDGVDELFGIYTDAYSRRLTPDDVEKVKRGVEQVARLLKIERTNR